MIDYDFLNTLVLKETLLFSFIIKIIMLKKFKESNEPINFGKCVKMLYLFVFIF